MEYKYAKINIKNESVLHFLLCQSLPNTTYVKYRILELTNKMPEVIKALAIASAMINVIVSCTSTDKVIIDKLKMNGIYVKLNLSQEKKIYFI